jgi:predicted nucleic acid-binding protein
LSRRPSKALVIDANIVLSAALGARTRPVIIHVGERRQLLTSAEAMTEALDVAAKLREAPAAPENVTSLLELIDVVGPDLYLGQIETAQDVLRNAVASRNGSANDAHILAVAWTYDADIWSHDRDFTGTGWPSWSSANLAAALAEEAGAEAKPS